MKYKKVLVTGADGFIGSHLIEKLLDEGISIPFSYLSPESYVDTNIKGTLNVLQAARKLDTEKVLITSTS